MFRKKTHKKILVALITVFFLSLSVFPAVGTADIASSLNKDTKVCQFINRNQYQLFSNINTNFAAFSAIGARVSEGSNCITVSGSINSLFDVFFKILVGIASVMAIINIAYAGIKTMLSESNVVQKGEWKKTVRASLEGLLIAITAWLLLSTINDRTLRQGFNFGTIGNVTAGVAAGQRDAIANAQPDTGLGGNPGNNKPGSPSTGSDLGESTVESKSGRDGYAQHPDWENKVRELVQSNGLDQLSPKDAAEFFPNSGGKPTADDWTRLVGEIIHHESKFVASDDYLEKDFAVPKYSVGLLSMSYDDGEVTSRGYTEKDLYDPYKNLEAGIATLKKTVAAGNCIGCGNSSKASVSGGAAYWSTLRGDKRAEIIRTLNQ